jgi:hypothetical protein
VQVKLGASWSANQGLKGKDDIRNVHGIARSEKKGDAEFPRCSLYDPSYSFNLLSLLTEACIIYVLLPSNKASWARTKNPGLGDVGSKVIYRAVADSHRICGAQSYFRLSQRRRYHWWFRVSAHSFNNQWLSFNQSTKRYCLLPVFCNGKFHSETLTQNYSVRSYILKGRKSNIVSIVF